MAYKLTKIGVQWQCSIKEPTTWGMAKYHLCMCLHLMGTADIEQIREMFAPDRMGALSARHRVMMEEARKIGAKHTLTLLTELVEKGLVDAVLK